MTKHVYIWTVLHKSQHDSHSNHLKCCAVKVPNEITKLKTCFRIIVLYFWYMNILSVNKRKMNGKIYTCNFGKNWILLVVWVHSGSSISNSNCWYTNNPTLSQQINWMKTKVHFKFAAMSFKCHSKYCW